MDRTISPVIRRILELSGPVPDPIAYRRYLATLTPEQLNRRAFDLAEDQKKPRTERVRFWRPQRLQTRDLVTQFHS